MTFCGQKSIFEIVLKTYVDFSKIQFQEESELAGDLHTALLRKINNGIEEKLIAFKSQRNIKLDENLVNIFRIL